MKIGIIGAGHIGETTAKLLLKAGHKVALCNSRGPESLKFLIKSLGPKATAMTPDEVVVWGELVILAVPWIHFEALPKDELVSGKIVIDAMNPFGGDESLLDLGIESSSEIVKARLPHARIVKAFNTLWYRNLMKEGHPKLPLKERFSLMVAGDDTEAVKVVSKLIEDVGFAPIFTGTLAQSKYFQEPSSPLFNVLLKSDEANKILKKL